MRNSIRLLFLLIAFSAAFADQLIDLFEQKSPADQNVLLIDEPLLYLQADAALIQSLASINPEAAMLLHVLVVRSDLPGAVAPATGDGGSRASTTVESVSAALQNESDDAIADLTAPLPAGQHSRWTWEVVKAPERTTLLIEHRIVNEQHEVVASPYPNIEVELQSNGQDRYRALSWKER